jgi:DNA-binding PucR family transcriptional regulator
MTYPDEIRFEVIALLDAVEKLRDARTIIAEAVFEVEQAHEPLVIETTEELSSLLVDELQEMIPSDGALDRIATMVRRIVREAAQDVEAGR